MNCSQYNINQSLPFLEKEFSQQKRKIERPLGKKNIESSIIITEVGKPITAEAFS